MSTMRAIHVADGSAGATGLDLIELPIPTITSPHDLLIRVRGSALNPVDFKTRDGGQGKILGYDGSGVVVEAGSEARFAKGDAVLWSGDRLRPGSNAEYQLVDSRLVAHKPESLPWDEAAALPLVGVTAWQMFEEKFKIKPGDNSEEILLIVNGAGGVGSIAIQLAKKVFGIKRIIVTASRPETIEFVKKLGATDVLNHREELGAQVKALGVEPTLVFITYDTPRYVKELAPHVQPYGQIGSIVGGPDIVPVHDPALFRRSLSFHWEYMMSKPQFQFRLESQGIIIDKLAKLAADGTIVSMVTQRETLSVASLRAAHQTQESGKVIGKIAFIVPETLS